jgi:Domain of unknown function (DUF2431)
MCGRWECAAALISFFSPCHTSFECAAWPEMYCSEALLPVGCMVPPAEPEECAAPSPVRSFALEQCRRRHDASATRAAAWNDPVTVTADVALWPEEEETWLVVGDGDFSFSVQLAHELSHSQGRSIRLVASVLESEERHSRVYRDSRENVQMLRATQHVEPRFEIDATRLERGFPAHSIDRIQFNFPHWPGKSNHRYNMQMLSDFFAFGCQVLTHFGVLHIALCHGQGGAGHNPIRYVSYVPFVRLLELVQ